LFQNINNMLLWKLRNGLSLLVFLEVYKQILFEVVLAEFRLF
jgi:hypothetical protein